MTVFQLKRDAENMQVPFHDAALCRLRYIRGEMHRLMEEIDTFSEYDPTTAAVAGIFFGDQFRELAGEQRLIVRALRDQRPVTDTITPDMIAQARQYPITQLIDFNRGVALAWCHPDKKPSLSHHVAKNRATCFPCGKSYDPISVLMQRDGMTFPAAVRQLAA